MFASRAVRLRLRPQVLGRRFESTSSGPRKASSFGNIALLAGSVATGALLHTAYYDLRKSKAPPPAKSTANGTVPVIDTKRGFPFEFDAPLSQAQATEKLNETSWSYTPTGVAGVARYDGAQFAANGPCEDRFVHGTFSSPWSSGEDWAAWGVFDGHIGGQTAEAVSKHIVPYVHNHLRDGGAGSPPDQDAAAVKRIKDAFVALDDTFVNTAKETADSDRSFADKSARLALASNGSCALLTLYDPAARTVRVACTGDSRAVMGRKTATGWEVVALSDDQTGSSESEKARVEALHPGEEGIVAGGRVLGLMCSRAFGDARWKWPVDLLGHLRKHFKVDYYSRLNDKYKTPPYITAEPEVTTTRLEAGQPSFMIVATDGLWDMLSNEEAVDLVGRWIEWQRAGRPAPQGEKPVFGSFDFNKDPDSWKLFDKAASTVQDRNAAVHLIRNALGGADEDKLSGVLGFKPPFARQVRDDITVQVVVFD